jgi:mannose-6-phosphate isomerase-like protein (cupin superfamily)
MDNPDYNAPLVLHEQDVQSHLDGDEVVRRFFRTGKLNFSVSTLKPGGKSSVDPGHTDAHEIGYIIQGVIRIEFPGLGQSFRLEAGDCVFIPEREPHTLYNVGTETARMTWSTAPNLGRPVPGSA